MLQRYAAYGTCQRGGIGRRPGLKIPCPRGRAGSTPATGTRPNPLFRPCGGARIRTFCIHGRHRPVAYRVLRTLCAGMSRPKLFEGCAADGVFGGFSERRPPRTGRANALQTADSPEGDTASKDGIYMEELRRKRAVAARKCTRKDVMNRLKGE